MLEENCLISKSEKQQSWCTTSAATAISPQLGLQLFSINLFDFHYDHPHATMYTGLPALEEDRNAWEVVIML